MDRTNKYRTPQKQAAYEVALALAGAMDDLGMDAIAEVARGLDHNLPRADRHQVAAKAVHVVQGWRVKAARGRPPGSEEPMVGKSVTLPADCIKYLMEVGRGNVSQGIRIVTEAHQAQRRG